MPTDRRTKLFAGYILAAAAFLVLQSFQGLSYLDEGMYLSGYQHFNDNPETMSFLGQWFLTYHVTGWLCDLLSADSFFALRMMRVVWVVFTQTVIWAYLRRYVDTRYIIVGLALATLAQADGYMDISYNDYSSTLLVAIVLLYHHGLVSRRLLWVLLAGVVAGVSVPFRIVNLTFLTLPFAVWVLRRAGLCERLRRHLPAFYAGVGLGFLSMLVLAVTVDDRFSVLRLVARDLTGVAAGPDDPHSMKAVFFSLYDFYKSVLGQLGIVAMMMALALTVEHRAKGAYRMAGRVTLIALFVMNLYFWEPVGHVTVAVSILGFLLLLFSPKDDALRLLYAMALLVPLLLPAGSNGGAAFFGQFLCFLTLPLAVTVMAKGVFLPENLRGAWPAVLRCSLVAFVLAVLYVQVKRPMMEEGCRLECRYTVDSPATRHILTNKANADMLNYMIVTVKPHVQVGSYMVCNCSLPLISILECRPYAVFSDVFTSDAMNSRYVDEAFAATGGKLPYMLLDREAMTPGFEALEALLGDYAPYESVWTDGRYELMAPTEKEEYPA